MIGALILLASLGIGVGWTFFNKTARLKRLLRAAPRLQIAALAEDTVGKIVGTVRSLGEHLIAPISGLRCVAYEVRVYADTGTQTHCVHTEACSVPFLIVDGEHRAVIDMEHAERALTFERHVQTGFIATEEAPLIERAGLTGKSAAYKAMLSYTEAIVEVGERIAVIGSGVREPDPDARPDGTYRDAQRTRVRFSGTPAHPLLVSD